MAFIFLCFLFYNISLGHHNILSPKNKLIVKLCSFKNGKIVEIMKEMVDAYQRMS